MCETYFCHDCKTADDFYQANYQPEPEEWVSGVLHPEDEGKETRCGQCHSNNIELETLCEACQNALPFDGCEDCATCIATAKHSHLRDYEDEVVNLAKAEIFDDQARELAATKQLLAIAEELVAAKEETIVESQKAIAVLEHQLERYKLDAAA